MIAFINRIHNKLYILNRQSNWQELWADFRVLHVSCNTYLCIALIRMHALRLMRTYQAMHLCVHVLQLYNPYEGDPSYGNYHQPTV